MRLTIYYCYLFHDVNRKQETVIYASMKTTDTHSGVTVKKYTFQLVDQFKVRDFTKS